MLKSPFEKTTFTALPVVREKKDCNIKNNIYDIFHLYCVTQESSKFIPLYLQFMKLKYLAYNCIKIEQSDAQRNQ